MASPEPFGHVAAALAEELGPEVPRQVIERCVADEAERLRQARIKTYVPLLVHKAARDRLRPGPSPTGGSIPPLAGG